MESGPRTDLPGEDHIVVNRNGGDIGVASARIAAIVAAAELSLRDFRFTA